MRYLPFLISIIASSATMAMDCTPSVPILDKKNRYETILIGDVVRTDLPKELLAMRREELRFDSGRRQNMLRYYGSFEHIVTVMVAEVVKGKAKKYELVELLSGGCLVPIPKLMSRGLFLIESGSNRAVVVYDDTPRKVGDLYNDWVTKARTYAR